MAVGPCGSPHLVGADAALVAAAEAAAVVDVEDHRTSFLPPNRNGKPKLREKRKRVEWITL